MPIKGLNSGGKCSFDYVVDLLQRSVRQSGDEQLGRVTMKATQLASGAIHHGNETEPAMNRARES